MQLHDFIFLTSARKEQHQRDLLNIVCHPKGTIIKFSYSNKWIHPRFQHLELYVGKKALLAYTEFTTYLNTNSKHHPIRLVKILGCASDDDGLSFMLQLDNFVEYDLEDKKNEPFLLEFNQTINPLITDSADPSKKWFIVNSDLKKLSLKFSGEWVRLVQHLKKLKKLEDCCFFQLKQTKDTSFLYKGLRAPRKSVAEAIPNFTVESGSSYNISMKCIAGKTFGDRVPLPTLEISPDLAQSLGPILTQYSEGTEASFQLNFYKLFENKQSAFRIYLSEAGTFKSPSIEGFVTAERKLLMLVISIACIAGSVIVASLNDIKLGDITISAKALAFFFSFGGYFMIHSRIKLL